MMIKTLEGAMYKFDSNLHLQSVLAREAATGAIAAKLCTHKMHGHIGAPLTSAEGHETDISVSGF